MDKIYLYPDDKNLFYLNCTRINGSNRVISRRGEDIDIQIKELSKKLNSSKVILADDVVFSGNVLKEIIKKFKEYDIEVIKIISAISTNKGFDYFNKELKYGLITNYLMKDDVIDQICERDFYFGVAGSGIMINTSKGLSKAPYFKPYGNPNERASIPCEYEDSFSKGCLERSLYLWQEIDKLKQRDTLIRDLPEKIIYTDDNESVQETLRRELKKCK